LSSVRSFFGDSPQDILRAVFHAGPGIQLHSTLDMFPPPQRIDELLYQISADPIHPSLAVINSHIPPAATLRHKHTSPLVQDSQGFSVYARIVQALVQVLLEDRHALKSNTWALRHFCALSIYAQDFLSIPSASSAVFGSGASIPELEALVSRVEQVMTYMLTSSSDEGWRLTAFDAALGKRSAESLETLPRFLFDTIEFGRESDNGRESRILWHVLQRTFHELDTSEADLWMMLARKMEVKGKWHVG